MSKAPSPLLGYNNNVRHKNRVFHIQTEDSGIKHPHVITHLFMDGGRILKSIKTSYAEHVKNEKLGDVVRQMMKEQHKAMFKALRDGSLDPVIEDALVGRVSRTSLPPMRPPAATIPDEAPPATTREPPLNERTDPSSAPVMPIPPAQDLTLDLEALERASEEPVPSFRPANDLPPPPANLFRSAQGSEPGTGRYRNLREDAPAPEEHVKSSRAPRSRSDRPKPRSERPRRESAPSRPDPRAEPPSEPRQPVAEPASARGRKAPSRPPARAPSRPPPATERHAPARPAAIFGQARPQQASIFGEDIISDKSLDEVILSYLAEDLEDGSK